ncbi:hypothetical protein [Sphingosinicella sp. CPCC 101087]|uniref:hypothetical protein n=1 Tax=Sphingosinicella sp. CPCC 101087 TaxID=2497754 RepID=UPI00101B9AE0|nr:hypothetical protein [Sphingosinicella sp. CPCC 101087]
MTDTAQGASPAKGGFASTGEALSAAALAFKVELGQEAPPTRRRDGSGRFAGDAAQGMPDRGPVQNYASESAPEDEGVQPGAESRDEDEEGHEASAFADASADESAEAEDEADQPAGAGLSDSWPTDKAQLWQSLDPDARPISASGTPSRKAQSTPSSWKRPADRAPCQL